MNALPVDVLQHILSFVKRADLTCLMRVSRQHYLYGRQCLYSQLHLDCFPPVRSHSPLHLLGGDWETPLAQTTLRVGHPAGLLRHLTISNAGLADVAGLPLLRQALCQMSGLLSLDFSIKTYPDSIARQVLCQELCDPITFLPALLALKTDDAEVARILVPGRPVYSVFVDDTVPASQVSAFHRTLTRSKCAITQLQIRLEATDVVAAVETFDAFTKSFSKVSTLCVELFLLDPPEKPLEWITMKVGVHHTSYRDVADQYLPGNFVACRAVNM